MKYKIPPPPAKKLKLLYQSNRRPPGKIIPCNDEKITEVFTRGKMPDPLNLTLI